MSDKEHSKLEEGEKEEEEGAIFSNSSSSSSVLQSIVAVVLWDKTKLLGRRKELC